MKNFTLVFLLFINCIAFGQLSEVQIKFYGNISEGVLDDPGLNDIFIANNVIDIYPLFNVVPEWSDRTGHVICSDCDIEQFEQALNNYSSVVERADQTELGTVANELFIILSNIDNGNTTGQTTSDGIVITDNASLNSIFADFNVLYYAQAFPSSNNPDLLKAFFVGCDCKAIDLLPILANENSIFSSVERTSYPVLGLEDLNKFDLQFYPNPVENNIVITSSEKINSYEIINMLGQSIFNGISTISINDYLPALVQGTYIMKVTTNTGKQQVFHFIKK